MRKILLVAAFFITAPALADCESGYYIQTLSEDGSLITLDDGSIWRVDSGDEADVQAWVDNDEILVCDDASLINKDEGNEEVEVSLLSR